MTVQFEKGQYVAAGEEMLVFKVGDQHGTIVGDFGHICGPSGDCQCDCHHDYDSNDYESYLDQHQGNVVDMGGAVT